MSALDDLLATVPPELRRQVKAAFRAAERESRQRETAMQRTARAVGGAPVKGVAPYVPRSGPFAGREFRDRRAYAYARDLNTRARAVYTAGAQMGYGKGDPEPTAMVREYKRLARRLLRYLGLDTDRQDNWAWLIRGWY